ncbi:MAG: hypothetical protein JRN20_17405 [Nitrososphaerota archaeon]|nr:hypothetical protein [Nitrososphaerota archaeon]
MTDRAILARSLTQICPLANVWMRGSGNLQRGEWARMEKSANSESHHKGAKSPVYSFASLPPAGSNLDKSRNSGNNEIDYDLSPQKEFNQTVNDPALFPGRNRNEA